MQLCISSQQVELAGAGHPEKFVKQLTDVQVWLRSEAYYDLVGFINGISTAIQGKKISDDIYISPAMENLIKIFDNLNSLVDATPPVGDFRKIDIFADDKVAQ